MTIPVVCHRKLGELFAVHSANVFPVSLLMLIEYVLALQTFQTCLRFESTFLYGLRKQQILVNKTYVPLEMNI